MTRRSALSLLSLHEIRRFIRRSGSRPAVVFFGLIYLLTAMTWGSMLTIAPSRLGYSVTLLWGTPLGIQAWNYPGLLITAPWGVIILPFFATLAMVASAVGVGLNMTVAFLLVVRLLRPASLRSRQSGAVGTVTGLTPAMVSLVTLGACCSTTGVATAGIGLIASATGTSVTALLINNWYLGLFQVALVWVALIAQELLLVVYGGLFGLEPLAGMARSPPKYDRRFAVGALLRTFLFVGGFLWIFGIFADWTSISPAAAGAGLWFRWIFEHGLLGTIAIVAALFPVGTAHVFRRIWDHRGRIPVAAVLGLGIIGGVALLVALYQINLFLALAASVVVVPLIARAAAVWARSGTGYVLGAFTLIAGLATVLWVPAFLAAAGVDSFGNELLGALGAPAAWGGLTPGQVDVTLVARWALEYLLVGGFAVFAVLRPAETFGPLLWSVGEPLPVEAGDGFSSSRSAPRSPEDVSLSGAPLGGSGSTPTESSSLLLRAP